jgi:tripartite-type tricarboxylate transporter receptor subunit TctC
VPTLAELGVKGMDYEQWFGVQAPTGAPNAKEYIGGSAMDVAL